VRRVCALACALTRFFNNNVGGAGCSNRLIYLGPTQAPTQSPTQSPIKAPTRSPTKSPVKAPTRSPTRLPTLSPSKSPIAPHRSSAQSLVASGSVLMAALALVMFEC